MALKLRKPTGLVPYPFVLIEGEEKAGKTLAIANLAASGRCGKFYWVDIGEADADRYGQMAEYMVVVHDGTYGSILEQVQDACAMPHEIDGKPCVIAIDSLSGLWSLIVDRAQNTANKRGGKCLISMDLWNQAKREFKAVVNELIRYEGIVIATARGKEVTEVKGGRPTKNKTWSVETEKSLPYDVDAWVRVTRSNPPVVVGLRSLKHMMRPGVDQPKGMPDFSLEKLIWGLLGVQGEVGKRHLPDAPQETLGGESPADEWHELDAQITATLEEMGILADDIERFQSCLSEKCKLNAWDEMSVTHLRGAVKRIGEGGEEWVQECIMETVAKEDK